MRMFGLIEPIDQGQEDFPSTSMELFELSHDGELSSFTCLQCGVIGNQD